MKKDAVAVGVVGGLGLMASPMAKHWKDSAIVRVLRVHDRGTPGARRERSRDRWREYGAERVTSLEAVAGSGDLDGVFVCAGKNADDVGVIGELAVRLGRRRRTEAPAPFLCHLSTVSTGFTTAAQNFCARQGVDYVNYPLTGGSTGAENATMLILAAGPRTLYDRLEPLLSCLGKPRYFGASPQAGAQVKFMGHMMVFNGLVGIASAAASHARCFQADRLGGAEQAVFFDFLNGGAGGTRQWDLVLKPALESDVWDAPFQLKYAAVDAIYTAALCSELRLSYLAAEANLNVALAFSYVLNHGGSGLATQAIVREMVAGRAEEFDAFVLRHSARRGDTAQGLKLCVASLPEGVQRTVGLEVEEGDFGGS